MTGELKQVSGSVTITNVRTGTVIFSGNNDDNSGNYAIPGSELVVGDNRFDIKGITIDDEQKIERLSVNLKPAVKAVLTLTNSGTPTTRKRSKRFMIRNSSDVQSMESQMLLVLKLLVILDHQILLLLKEAPSSNH